MTQNGLPIVFLGASNFMVSAESAAARLSYSIYIACSYQTSEEQHENILRASSSDLPTIEIKGNTWTSFPPGANGRVYYGTFNAIAACPDAVDGAQILSFHLDMDAESGEIMRGTSVIGTGLAYSVQPSQTDEDWTIGFASAEQGYAGYLFEIAIYRGDRPHNSGERLTKIGELSTKWGI